jgi:hypothetical protein
VTGYVLVRHERLRPAPPGSRPRQLGARQPLARFDREAREIMLSVKPRTMTSYQKLFALIVGTRYVIDRGIPGAIVECGVWRGGSMQAVARTLLARRVTDRDLHLFDTFAGMPAPTDRDVSPGGEMAKRQLARRPTTAKVWAVASLEDVQAGMAETGYPTERVHFHVGLVEDTIPGLAPERIAILRLDTDWYESTRYELEQLYDRVAPGGVIILDDYDYWEGAGAAVDEFIERTGARLLLVPIGTGRITVKP